VRNSHDDDRTAANDEVAEPAPESASASEV
jgi:hypothetical protein